MRQLREPAVLESQTFRDRILTAVNRKINMYVKQVDFGSPARPRGFGRFASHMYAYLEVGAD